MCAPYRNQEVWSLKPAPSTYGSESRTQMFWTLATFRPLHFYRIWKGGSWSPLTTSSRTGAGNSVSNPGFEAERRVELRLRSAPRKTSAFNIALLSNHYNLTHKFAADISMWSKAFRTIQGNSSRRLEKAGLPITQGKCSKVRNIFLISWPRSCVILVRTWHLRREKAGRGGARSESQATLALWVYASRLREMVQSPKVQRNRSLGDTPPSPSPSSLHLSIQISACTLLPQKGLLWGASLKESPSHSITSCVDLLRWLPHPASPSLSSPGKEGYNDPGLYIRECGSWSVLEMEAPGFVPGKDLSQRSSPLAAFTAARSCGCARS